MTEVLLFHHAQGQTAGFDAFAEELRRGLPSYDAEAAALLSRRLLDFLEMR
jgi:hypothetical protein